MNISPHHRVHRSSNSLSPGLCSTGPSGRRRRGDETPFPRPCNFEYEYEYEYDGGIRSSHSRRTRTRTRTRTRPGLRPQRGPGIQPRAEGASATDALGCPTHHIRALKGHRNRPIRPRPPNRISRAPSGRMGFPNASPGASVVELPQPRALFLRPFRPTGPAWCIPSPRARPGLRPHRGPGLRAGGLDCAQNRQFTWPPTIHRAGTASPTPSTTPQIAPPSGRSGPRLLPAHRPTSSAPPISSPVPAPRS